MFVLKSQTKVSTSACFAKDFYPKDVQIYINSTERNAGPIEVSPVLTRQGKYSAVLVADLGTKNVQCQAKHQEKWVTMQDNLQTSEDTMEQPEEKCVSAEVHYGPSEKNNMFSLTVLGLRVLFTKAVAFNLIMTAKFIGI